MRKQQTSAVTHDEPIASGAARRPGLTSSTVLLAPGAILWPAGDPDDADAVAILTARLHRQGKLAGRRLG